MKEIMNEELTDIETLAPPDTIEKKFVPKGAIAFFILLVLLALFIWFSIYFLMLERT
jgi:hypothetical protein